MSPQEVEEFLARLGVPRPAEVGPRQAEEPTRRPGRRARRPPERRRRDPAYRHAIMSESALLRTPLQVHVRASRTGKPVVWWTSPCCGARLNLREEFCRECGQRVRDEALLMKAAAQHMQLCREFMAAIRGVPVAVVRQRVDGQRPRCPACNRALALDRKSCVGCGALIEWQEPIVLASQSTSRSARPASPRGYLMTPGENLGRRSKWTST